MASQITTARMVSSQAPKRLCTSVPPKSGSSSLAQIGGSSKSCMYRSQGFAVRTWFCQYPRVCVNSMAMGNAVAIDRTGAVENDRSTQPPKWPPTARWAATSETRAALQLPASSPSMAIAVLETRTKKGSMSGFRATICPARTCKQHSWLLLTTRACRLSSPACMEFSMTRNDASSAVYVAVAMRMKDPKQRNRSLPPFREGTYGSAPGRLAL
mmetsp:Transcript_22312/g.40064  ORF Transcript_22312/g.40064 Transcript_22312/m.40064 type:complete len:213 (+) Transcript_22312:566-1204(+)